MANIRHLSRAPVIEAILGFQADASKAWDADLIREGLAAHFADFPEVQDQRSFESQISVAPGGEPQTKTTLHPVNAFLLQREDRTAAVQIRRDGFAFSQLPPYLGWEAFTAAALGQWEICRSWLEVGVPYTAFIRFINRVAYPADGFHLKTYFENPPRPPEGTDWKFRFFREHHVYAPGEGDCSVEAVFSPTGPANSEGNLEFILDLTVSPVDSLSVSGMSIESLLPRFRSLKNDAFFSRFTEEGLRPYH